VTSLCFRAVFLTHNNGVNVTREEDAFTPLSGVAFPHSPRSLSWGVFQQKPQFLRLVGTKTRDPRLVVTLHITELKALNHASLGGGRYPF